MCQYQVAASNKKLHTLVICWQEDFFASSVGLSLYLMQSIFARGSSVLAVIVFFLKST